MHWSVCVLTIFYCWNMMMNSSLDYNNFSTFFGYNDFWLIKCTFCSGAKYYYSAIATIFFPKCYDEQIVGIISHRFWHISNIFFIYSRKFFFHSCEIGTFFFLLIALSQSTFNFSLLLYVALCIFTISKCKVINLYSQMMCKNSDFYAKEKKNGQACI